MTIHFYSNSDSVSRSDSFGGSEPPKGLKKATANFDFAAEIKKLAKSKGITSVKSPEEAQKEQKAARCTIKAQNGMTWEQVQNKIKDYYEKYVPETANFEEKLDVFEGYTHLDIQNPTTNKLVVDYRAYIRDHMPEEDKVEFDKVCAAYDEIKSKLPEDAGAYTKYGEMDI